MPFDRWPFRPNRRNRNRRNDAASMHVLEAVIIASIMVSAVAYVVTYENPPKPGTPSRELLRQKSEDALKILYDTPVAGSAKGDNALSVFLVECMAGNCTNLTDRLDKLVPEGASYALYVSNGYDTYPVYVVRQPSGEAVTATHLLEPKWSHSFVATARNNVNPTTDPLLVYSLPVFNGNVISEGGSPLRVIAYGTRLSDGSNYTLTANYATQAVKAEDQGLVPAVSMNFLAPLYDFETQSVEFWFISGVAHYNYWTVNATGAPTLAPQTLRIEVNNTGTAKVPAGTEIVVDIPRGWKAIADQAANSPRWKILSNATDGNGTRGVDSVRAVLLSDLVDEAIEFQVQATYYGDALNWYPFRAYLSKGVLAEANLLVRADIKHDDTQTLRAPGVRLSAPRPMGGGQETTWTVTWDVPFAIGSNTNLHLGRLSVRSVDTSVMLNRIEIIEQTGAKIFGPDVQPLTFGDLYTVGSDAYDNWTSEGDRLVWEGAVRSDGGPFSFSFTVAASGVEGSQDQREPFAPPADFDEVEGRLLSRIAAGFYRDPFLPEVKTGIGVQWKGYDTSILPGVEFDVRSDALYRTTLLPGSRHYGIEDVPSPTDALFGSYVNVETPSVPVGGEVVLNADIQSMLFALADAGQEAGVTVHFYPPWAGDERTPIHTIENLDSGLLDSKVTALAVLDLNSDGFPDPVVGTSNGRVIGMHGLTGARLSGKVFIVPVDKLTPGEGGAQANNTVSAVTHVVPIEIAGTTYIAIGTSENSGLYVIDRDFKQRWNFSKSAYETVALDGGVDIDQDGRNELLAAVRKPGDASNTFSVYVLSAPAGGSLLVPILPNVPFQSGLGTATVNSAAQATGAFFSWTGDPSALVGMPGIGTVAGARGFSVSLRTLVGAAAYTNLGHGDPIQNIAETSFQIETPRHGIIGLDREGNEAFLFFGSPVTTARAYDHDRDPKTEIVAGSPSGYVYMLNGTMATQPAYPILYPGPSGAEDGECIDGLRCVVLTLDGTVMFTRDGWATRGCVSCDPITHIAPPFLDGTSVSINGSNSFWMAGLQNRLWKTVPHPVDPTWPFFEEVTLNVLATVAGSLQTLDLNAQPQNFYDVYFRSGADAHRGWVVGGSTLYPVEAPCAAALCPSGYLMMTEDNGATWRRFTHADDNFTMATAGGGEVTATLKRINFTTSQVGWITGTGGTLLMTTDGGYRWNGVPNVPTTATLNDVSCAPGNPDFCLVVGDGFAARLVNATTTPEWTVLTERLGTAASTRDLFSVGVSSEDLAFIGTTNMLLATYDGGNNWTTLPMNYLENDATRIVVTPDGFGYAFGGDAQNYRVFHIHDFLLNATLQTKNVATMLDADDRVELARLHVEVSMPANANAAYYVSADGGQTWTSFSAPSSGSEERTENEMKHSVTIVHLTSAEIPEASRGSDVRLRVQLNTSAATPILTPVIRKISWEADYYDPDVSDWRAVPPTDLDLSSMVQVDVQNTTAAWDTATRSLHLPLARELWTANVSGGVLDVETGFDVTGDWREDVWVSTGAVLAGNSPDYHLYAGSDEDVVGDDNRVYLLDGRNGSIVARSAKLAGKVTSIALSDTNGGAPDALFATVRGGSGTSVYTHLVSLDPVTLATRWTENITRAEPVDVQGGAAGASTPTAFLGTTPFEAGGQSGAVSAIPSRVWSVADPDGNERWSSLPDERGRYFLNYTIPKNWFFGPYVVEVVVDWKDVVTNGQGVSREVLQAARFYDYFMVTPPGSLSPPSPVYNVHLVTWFNDWG